ncbi:SDR family NAD(P)-dependent oxidoreductase [Shewanella fidelis]|uniref:SDR family NAD(P)-dependent oxidoreductase n=1 Tax=Shewanella fidelis TaxID=173509 RepID=UPI0004B3CF9E|nr:SDR family NAD(P)-dependent oxidoreductase [Shewanella fidelis]
MNTCAKRVLITGASSGIGLQLAQDYLADGWQVYACGRNPQALSQLAGAERLLFDVTDNEQVQAQAKALTAKGVNSFDLVILNAGSCEYIDDAKQFDAELFERVIRTNLIAMGYCLAAFTPLIKAGGRLGLMGSSAVYLPFPRAEAYGASKAGVQYLASSLAIDLKPHNIGVSVICPGFVKTPLTDKNDFAMPMRLSSEQASNAIRQGLAKGVREIHFPKRFTLLLKLISLLPFSWWQRINQPKAVQANSDSQQLKAAKPSPQAQDNHQKHQPEEANKVSQ